MCSELRRIAEGSVFDSHEQLALDIASAAGGVLYQAGPSDRAYVISLPASPVGRQAVLCVRPAVLADAERMAVERGLREVVLLMPLEGTPQIERLPNGLRLWSVPQRCMETHGRRRRAGEVVPWLLDFTFGTRS